MSFVSQQEVRFGHVDAAGIVFYPRYFELLNAAVEDYFASIVGVTFAEMHRDRRLGVPTVKLETDFVAPSRLGDTLNYTLIIDRVGRSSIDLRALVQCDDEVRVRIRAVIVCMNLDSGRSEVWPADMRPDLTGAAAA